MRRLKRSIAPLYAAALLQNLALWVPIEKLFMTMIGFDRASTAAADRTCQCSDTTTAPART
jgi:hypothetical protein